MVLVEAIPEEPVPGLVAALILVLVAVLVLPFASKRVEENLEAFFLAMGVVSLGVSYFFGIITGELLEEVLLTAATSPVSVSGLPVGIVQAVLFFGLVFYYFHKPIYRVLDGLIYRAGLPLFTFILVTVLGLVSSIISVIVTAVILSEVVAAIKVPREAKLRLAVYGCFAVGIGAALTPIGEPLATIAVSKLEAPFTYLFSLLGVYVVLGVLVCAAVSAYSIGRFRDSMAGVELTYGDTIGSVIERAVRVFAFVAALEMLGASFTPLTVWYFSKLPTWGLYWLNTISAVLDNATLTAAEISRALTSEQIRSALISLLISGGMLIPGNIPNIVTAGKLKITMREWARVGLPLGAALLLSYFVIIEVLGIHISLGEVELD